MINIALMSLSGGAGGGGAGSEVWNQVYMIAPVRPFRAEKRNEHA